MTKSHVLDFDWAWCEAASSSTQAGAFKKKDTVGPRIVEVNFSEAVLQVCLYLDIALLVR